MVIGEGTPAPALQLPECRRNIPAGKFRVVGVDLFDHEDFILGDYDTKGRAFVEADGRNSERTGAMDTVFYVYNDQGAYIHGPEHHPTKRIGVTP